VGLIRGVLVRDKDKAAFRFSIVFRVRNKETLLRVGIQTAWELETLLCFEFFRLDLDDGPHWNKSS
jgi:hypothetical protein